MCIANTPAPSRAELEARLACPLCGRTVCVTPAAGGVVVMCTSCQKATSVVPIELAGEKWEEVRKKFF